MEVIGANLLHYWQITFMEQDRYAQDGTFIPKGTMVMGFIDAETLQVTYWRYLRPIK